MNKKRELWREGYNPGVTGPTTPSLQPFCGGEDWPYRTINVGQETIAIVPAQTHNRIVGKKAEPMIDGRIINAKLIVSAVNACIEINPNNPQAVAEAIGDMYRATRIALDLVKTVLYNHPDDDIAQEQKKAIENAIAKSEGR